MPGPGGHPGGPGGPPGRHPGGHPGGPGHPGRPHGPGFRGPRMPLRPYYSGGCLLPVISLLAMILGMIGLLL